MEPLECIHGPIIYMFMHSYFTQAAVSKMGANKVPIFDCFALDDFCTYNEVLYQLIPAV